MLDDDAAKEEEKEDEEEEEEEKDDDGEEKKGDDIDVMTLDYQIAMCRHYLFVTCIIVPSCLCACVSLCG